jgi:hypothetical protein
VWPEALESEEDALVNARAAIMAAFVSAVMKPETCLYMLATLEAIEEGQIDLKEGGINLVEVSIDDQEDDENSPFDDFINNELIM